MMNAETRTKNIDSHTCECGQSFRHQASLDRHLNHGGCVCVALRSSQTLPQITITPAMVRSWQSLSGFNEQKPRRQAELATYNGPTLAQGLSGLAYFSGTRFTRYVFPGLSLVAKTLFLFVFSFFAGQYLMAQLLV